MKVLVTGGAGFIGSHLTDALVAEGATVLVVDDLSRGRRNQVNERAEFVNLDIADPGLEQIVKSFAPQAVFHLAAQIDVRRSVTDPGLDARINVLGTVNLLQSCVQAEVNRVIFSSSGGAVYGDTDVLPTPEETPCHPDSVYGASKLAGEIYGELFQRLHGLGFVALRYTNVYGPRQDPHGEAGVVAIFSQSLLDGSTPIINGDGRQTRDYIYVGDVVSANLAAWRGNVLGAYNIGTGRECDVKQLYSTIAQECRSSAEPKHGPAKAGEQKRSCVDISLARERLGWEPKTSLAEGITETVAYFRGSPAVSKSS